MIKVLSIATQVIGGLLMLSAFYVMYVEGKVKMGLGLFILSFGYMCLWVMTDNLNKDYTIKSYSAFLSAIVGLVLSFIALVLMS